MLYLVIISDQKSRVDQPIRSINQLIGPWYKHGGYWFGAIDVFFMVNRLRRVRVEDKN